MKISASVYSNKDKSLETIVKELDHNQVDYFHIDCLDDLSVFEDIEKIKAISKVPADLHIISSDAKKFFPHIEKVAPAYVSFQFEDLQEVPAMPKIPHVKFGLAISSDTDIEVFDQFQHDFHHILIMTTTPGKSGGVFNKENFEKIRKFKKKYPNKKVHVDGGVNDEISFILRNLGVDLIVSGSFLVNAESVGSALISLKNEEVASHYRIKDFMHSLAETPIIEENSLTLKNTLTYIEDYDLGYVLISDKDGVLTGLISNADIRKGLLRNIDKDLNQLDVKSFINRNPIFIHQDRTIDEMLKLIKSKNFPISYLPVVDKDKKISGTVQFFNLIKGES